MKLWRTLPLLTLAFFLVACEAQDPHAALPAAPVNNHAALEKLAQAWHTAEKEIATAPRALSGPARKAFVVKVFATAGYNYTATLQALAAHAVSTQDTKDLVELALLPHRNAGEPVSLQEIYSPQELHAVRILESRSP